MCYCFSWATDFDFKHCLLTQWKVEVIADRSGKWCSNGVTFPTWQKADEYGKDLFGRWTAVREYRVVEAIPTDNYLV